MSFMITKENDNEAYGLVEITADTVKDLDTIDTTPFSMGSSCLVLENATIYILDSKKQWKKI